MIDKDYMPFSIDELKCHFIHDTDEQFKKQIAYYKISAERYHQFLKAHPKLAGISVSNAKEPRQIEKDERFWTVTSLKKVFDLSDSRQKLSKLLSIAFGPNPQFSSFGSWEECLEGKLELLFEVCVPSPELYCEWLKEKENLEKRQLIPYILDATIGKKGALEGPTHIDAVIINRDNRFAWLIEAKVLSDISGSISFDNFRNQMIRNIDIMLSKPRTKAIEWNEKTTLFSLLTPTAFKKNPHSRLYGWLYRDYTGNRAALGRDLPHRVGLDASDVMRRIGWLTYEDIHYVCPHACPWLNKAQNSRLNT